MKNINIAGGEINASQIALGLMRIADMPINEIANLISAAIDGGINFFDNADKYSDGKCEEVFAKAFNTLNISRDKVYLQTKCGIRKGYYDFSKEHIIESVEGSLKRLNTDYIDVLLLHRPDALVEPEEVAEAFSKLHRSGKVRYFGVSNHNPMQIELLNKYLNHKLIINQLQFSVMHTGMVDQGIHVNMNINGATDKDGSILDYCRLKNITIQAWSPFQYGFFEGVFLDNDKFPELNEKIDEIAKKYNVPNSAIAIAWIMRHPAKIQAIVGTTKINRLNDIMKASSVNLTRPEWYDIYKAAGNMIP